MRRDPKASLEGDLKAVLVGVVITFAGSVLVAGTYYWTRLNTQPGPPMPVLGTVIFFIGGAVIVIGVVLALLCLAVSFWGWLGKEAAHDDDPSSKSP